jgi:hypothetical protein
MFNFAPKIMLLWIDDIWLPFLQCYLFCNFNAIFFTFSKLPQKFPIGQRLATSIEEEQNLKKNGFFNKNTYT